MSPAVLVAPVQGSEELRDSWGRRVTEAVERALRARDASVVSRPLLGRAVVACQTPECIDQTLDAAEADLAIAPAVWTTPDGGQELTLTLLRRVGRNLNASDMLGTDANVDAAATVLVDRLLLEHVAATPLAEAAEAEPADGRSKHPNAWKAGPIVLLAGGAAAFIAIGVGAAAKRQDQQLDTTAVAAWSALGATAIAGGITWWVVGAKRRRATLVALGPSGIDLRLRF